MKKRVIAVMLAALLVVAGCMGCGNQSSTQKESTSENTQENAAEASIDLITEWEAKATIALGTSVQIEGTGITQEEDVLLISEGGAYIFSGTAEQICIMVDTKEDVKIILDGVEITNITGPVIYGNQANSLYIETAKGTTNLLSDGSSYETDDEGNAIGKATIFCNDTLILLGEGSLEINGNYKHGICSDDDIYFEGGTYDIQANVTDGVHANDLICVDAGTLEIQAISDGMESEAQLVINGGSIVCDSEDEGMESKDVMTINGGSIELSVVDDGLNATNEITINGGNIQIHCTTGDAIDSNGTMTINGGTIVAYGGSAPEGGLDCDMSAITINGGTVLAVGDENSSISEEGAQATVLLGAYTSGSEISVVDENDKELFSFTLEEARNNIILSLPDFAQDASYTVKVNGEEDQTFTVDSMVISAGGTVGAMGGGMRGGTMGGAPNQNRTMPQMDGTENMPQMDGSEDMFQRDGNATMPQMNQN